MLEECLHYLEEKLKTNPENTFEVIIVDDGSTDKTTQVGLGYSEKYGSDKVRVLTLSNNRGKGGAVRLVIIFYSNFDKSQLIIDTYISRECLVLGENSCCLLMLMEQQHLKTFLSFRKIYNNSLKVV